MIPSQKTIILVTCSLATLLAAISLHQNVASRNWTRDWSIFMKKYDEDERLKDNTFESWVCPILSACF